MNFFTTYKIEASNKYETDFNKIWARYFHGNFLHDLFIWLPLGLLAKIHTKLSFLRVLWLVKILRIKYFISILDEKYINPILRNYYIKDLEKHIAKSQSQKEELNVNHNKINTRV